MQGQGSAGETSSQNSSSKQEMEQQDNGSKYEPPVLKEEKESQVSNQL